MKTFEAYSQAGKSELKIGDRVCVVYRDATDYLKVGTIVSMTITGFNSGDCSVLMDYSQKIKQYYYTNLSKVFELVEVPSGEVIYIYDENLIELSGLAVIKWNSAQSIYYYQESDRWLIEEFMI
jgi:hypothetical protein